MNVREELNTKTRQMKSQLEQINIRIKKIEEQLSDFPEGKLICARNGKNNWKWYHSNGQTSSYIPKQNRKLAERLAIKKYLALQLEDLVREQKAIEGYLKYQNEDIGKADKLLTDTSEYQKLLRPYFKSTVQELSEWSDAPFEQNKKYPERLIYRSISGHLLRSKSEVMIDMQLYSHQIPFRYECALEVCGTVIYPDFTIRHPKTGELFYWEHFGMMDDSVYAKNVCSKLQFYISNNIIPSINLITTYETKSCPLDIDEIEEIITHYFLQD